MRAIGSCLFLRRRRCRGGGGWGFSWEGERGKGGRKGGRGGRVGFGVGGVVLARGWGGVGLGLWGWC